MSGEALLEMHQLDAVSARL